MKEKIGRLLKKFRTEKGLTQKGLADSVVGGLDYTYIGKIERGEQLPSLKILMKISEALSVPVGRFFPDETGVAVSDVSSPETDYKPRNESREMLLKELELIHDDDLPLLVEIARALRRHRKTTPA